MRDFLRAEPIRPGSGSQAKNPPHTDLPAHNNTRRLHTTAMNHNTSRTIIDDELAVQYIKTLEQERLKRRLTIIDLSVKTGVSYTAIGNYELGNFLPLKRLYNKLAKFFNWPLYQSGRKVLVQRPLQRQIPITMPQEKAPERSTQSIASKLSAIEQLIKEIKEQIPHAEG